MSGALSFDPIGVIRSPFHDKFGLPRQGYPHNQIPGCAELANTHDMREALHGLEGFSHLWLITVFDKHIGHPFKPRIRPPRFGGSDSIGVFASRSPHRPNPISLTCVKLLEIDTRNEAVIRLHVLGVDMVDQSPLLDIKPYVAYADAQTGTQASWAIPPEPTLDISWSDNAKTALDKLEKPDKSGPAALRAIIEMAFAHDPRPAHQREKERDKPYRMRIHQYDVTFCITENVCTIEDLQPYTCTL